MRQAFILSVLTLLTGGACVDQIDLTIDSAANKIVVDGLITNRPGPYTVKISRSLNFDSDRVPEVYLVPETGATVSIEDGDGTSYLLTEVSAGIYRTSAGQITGEEGETYILKFTTNEGKNYESKPELMPEATEINGLAYKYHVYERMITNSEGNPVVDKQYGFLLSVVVDDPSTERNYYRWMANGIFEFYSINDDPAINHCWAPIFQLENVVTVKDDRYVNGNQFKHDVSIIPYERETKFLARVSQFSMTKEAFDFWYGVSKQQTGTGSIFDPAPGRVKGNMFNANDEKDVVFGYFGASAITKDSIMINRFDASGRVSPSPRIAPEGGDCRDHVPFATNVRPPGF
jgi:hypothetical protein